MPSNSDGGTGNAVGEEKREIEQISLELGELQRAALKRRLPIILLVDGWEASGKGTLINQLVSAMDPRGYRVVTRPSGGGELSLHQPLDRHYRQLPAGGEILIVDQSWYDDLWRKQTRRKTAAPELQPETEALVAFERSLVDNGTLLVKCFLHISSAEQRKRFAKLVADSATAWRIDEADLHQLRHRRRYRNVIQRILEATNLGPCSTLVIAAGRRRQALLHVLRAFTTAIREALAKSPSSELLPAASGVALADAATCVVPSVSGEGTGEAPTCVVPSVSGEGTGEAPTCAVPSVSGEGTGEAPTSAVPSVSGKGSGEAPTCAVPGDARRLVSAAMTRFAPGPNPLDQVPLDQCVTRERYELELVKLQGRLRQLEHLIYRERVPVMMLFEGWDAAGKGGSIRRLVAGLDPRGYEVVPVAAPTELERRHHYLWRFWRRMPRAGHITLFDRSWYGRVLVERVEGFCTREEWQRAYAELASVEKEFVRQGGVLLKFWFHIDQKTQLERFQAREATPEKRWKITEEDWRNRAKWDAYEIAVADMLTLTHTTQCPWSVVPANDKLFTRLFTLETAVCAIEQRLHKHLK